MLRDNKFLLRALCYLRAGKSVSAI